MLPCNSPRLFPSLPEKDGSVFPTHGSADMLRCRTLNPPADFPTYANDYEQPAIWRQKLEGLSRTINFGKK